MPRRWLQGSAQGFNPGNPQNNEFALKGREADLISSHLVAAQNLECAIETCYNWTYFRVVSTFDLPPLQHLQPGEPGVFHGTHIHVPCEGESLWAAVPRV
jgi:hypothetical protein